MPQCSPYWDAVQSAHWNLFGSRLRSQLEVNCYMTIFCVLSKTFEKLEGFCNNSPQMFTILKWCAERMLQPLWFKVEVTIRDYRSYDNILCPLNNFWTARRILKYFATNVNHTETKCRINVTITLVQSQGCNFWSKVYFLSVQ